MLGPLIFPGRVNGQIYLNFLEHDLEEMLDNLNLQTLRNLRFYQQDGAAPHNSRIVSNYLSQRFPNSWIGTNGPVRWLPRSPCLNPLDYFLWGFIKNSV